MKKKSTAYILLFLVGVVGGHYLYLEKPVSFLARAVTLNFSSFWLVL
ncbi:NINE protein [Bacillus pacificus]